MHKLRAFFARALRYLSKKIDPLAELSSPADQFFYILASTGYQPHTVLDIGANRGGWTKKILKYFPEAKYYLLEPQVLLKENLAALSAENPNVVVSFLGAGSSTGTSVFTVNADRDDSSTFSMTAEEAAHRGFKQMEMPVTTVDDFMIEKQISELSILKIDAEGVDLDVLQGARVALSQADYVFVECAILRGDVENTLAAVVNKMDREGFKLVDVTDFNRTQKLKALWLIEAAFVRKNEGLDKIISSYSQ